MSSVIVTYEGPPAQRHVVKATAMTPLSAILAEACSAMKPALDPAKATLVFNKKPVTDMQLPFRLANIPNGSMLTLQYKGEVPRFGVPAAPTPSAANQPQPAAVGPAPVSATAPPPAHEAAPAAPRPADAPMTAQAADVPALVAVAAPAAPSAPVAAAQPQAAVPDVSADAERAGVPPPAGADTEMADAVPAPSVPPSPTTLATSRSTSDAAAAHAPATQQAGPEAPAAPPSSAPSAGSAPAPAPVPVAASPAAPEEPDSAMEDAPAAAPVAEVDQLGLGRAVALFTRQALEEGIAAAHASDAPGASDDEEFFEMTAEDFALVMRSSEARKKHNDVGLKTRALREADEQRKADAYGPVAVRLHLPGDIIMQASFAATETIEAVSALVRGVLSPQLAKAFYLYTTPPRTLLKDPSLSLYKAQLVPAAHIHVGLDEKAAAATAAGGGASSSSGGGAVLRSEAQALVQTSIGPEVVHFTGGHGSQQQQQQRRGAGVGASSSGASGAAGTAATHGSATGSSGAAQRAGAAGSAGGGNKAPKWLKLGPK